MSDHLPTAGQSLPTRDKSRVEVTGTFTAPTSDCGKHLPGFVPDLPEEFTLLEFLGQGGMGQVFKVRHNPLNLVLALKILLPGKGSNTKLERFRQEARAMMELDHPHVARFYDYGEYNGIPYLTMKYLRGGSLASRLKEFQQHPKRSLNLLIQVCEAVHYLHQRGMIHRDLKPQNILLDEKDQAYISDFGLVKAIEEDTVEIVHSMTESTPDVEVVEPKPHLTATGAQIGTLYYMSPEQVNGTTELTPAADIWAVGVIAYELLVGIKPFQSPIPKILHQQIREEPPPQPRSLQPDLDESLEGILLKCLAKEPSQRYRTAEDLAEDLKRWQTQKQPPTAKRTVRWNWVALALIPVLGLLLWGIASYSNKSTDTTPIIEVSRSEMLDGIRQRLQAGETVSFIDEQGRWITPIHLAYGSTDTTTLRTTPDNQMLLTTTDWTLFEILDDVGLESYECQVILRPRQERSNPILGMYVGHRYFEDDTLKVHFYLSHIYREPIFISPPNDEESDTDLIKKINLPAPNVQKAIPGKQPKDMSNDTRAVALVGRYFVPKKVTTISEKVCGYYQTRIANPTSKQIPWRRLILRVTPPKIGLIWDSQPVIDVPRPLSSIRIDQVNICKQKMQPPLDFDPRYNLGLFLQAGSAEIKSVDVRLIQP